MTLAVAAAMVFLAPAMAAAGQAVEPSRTALTIVALGDSLTSGHRLPANQAYPAVLQELLAAEGLPFKVINHGVSGDTTAGGARRVGRALGEQPQVLIVALGANDGLRGVPVAQVRANLVTIIEAAQQRGVGVLLCAMDALPVNGWQYTLDFHNLYYDLADQYKVPLVPFVLGNILGNRALMSPDGVHPNQAGARVLAEAIYPYVKALAEPIHSSQVKIHK